MQGRKRGEDKNRTKTKGNKQRRVTGVVDISPTVSVITVTVNGPNAPMERLTVRVDQRHSSTVRSLRETHFKYRPI